MDGENFMTLEVDATDQLQWGLPQFPEITKQDGTVRLKSHLVIAVARCGDLKECFVYDSL